MSNHNWLAVYISKGKEFRFPILEKEGGKFLEVAGEIMPFKIGLDIPELGRLIYFRTEQVADQEETQPPKTTEEKET